MQQFAATSAKTGSEDDDDAEPPSGKPIPTDKSVKVSTKATADEILELSDDEGELCETEYVAPRPSDDVIAKLTPAQKRQALKSLIGPELRAILGMSPHARERKEDLISMVLKKGVAFLGFCTMEFSSTNYLRRMVLGGA